MQNTIIYDKIDEVQGKVEYNGGGINALQQDTAALLAKGVVKSVQRGFAQGTGISASTTTTVNIEISTVNAGKCAVLVNAITTIMSNSGAPSVIVKELQPNRLILDISYPGVGFQYMTYSWQVIEFY